MTAADPRDGHQASLHDLSADMMQAVSECDDIALLGAHVIGFANRLTALAHARPEAVDAEFEVHAGGEYFASVSGPRATAWREAMHYIAVLSPDDGEPSLFEVTRTQITLTPERAP